jgi:head-tail adaptor
LSLDRKLIFYRPVLAKSASGMESVSYEKVALPSWGELQISVRGSGSEDQEGKQKVAARTDAFKIRFRADIQETWIMDLEGVKYDILGIQPMQRRSFLKLTAEQKDNDREIYL